MTWQHKAIAAATNALSFGIVDGVGWCEDWIEDEIIRPQRPDISDYDNGEYSWCNAFVQYCWVAGGFRVPINLHSVWRTVHVYGRYGINAMEGQPHWCVVRSRFIDRTLSGFCAVPVKTLHNASRSRLGMRQVVKPEFARPGDCLCHLTGSKGHAMLVAGRYQQSPTVAVIEGNSSKTMGPNGDKDHGAPLGLDQSRRDGVGVRYWNLDDPYLTYAVRPSLWDFVQGIEYFTSLEAAEERAEQLNGG